MAQEYIADFLAALSEPHLYSFAVKITEAKEAVQAQNRGNVTSMQQWHLRAATKALAERYDTGTAAVYTIERVARGLHELSARKRRGRVYQFHDIKDVWKTEDLQTLETAITDAEIGKEGKYAKELHAINSSHIFNTKGHIYTIDDDIGKGLAGMTAGSMLATAGVAFAAVHFAQPYPLNLVAIAAGVVGLTAGGATIGTNIASIAHTKLEDPFTTVADELQKRAQYIREALR